MALTAMHPGEHLAEELQALDMSAAELARKIDVNGPRAKMNDGFHPVTQKSLISLQRLDAD